MKKIIWQDFETGGLDHNKHSPLSFAMLATDGDKIIGEWYTHIRQSPMVIDSQAIAINKIDIREPGLNFEQFGQQYNSLMNKWFYQGGKSRPSKDNMPYYGGHNTMFDRPFIQRILNSSFDLAGYHRVDTMVLATSLKVLGLLDIENVKLETLARHFGCHPETEMHNALVDIKTTFQVFLKMKELLTDQANDSL